MRTEIEVEGIGTMRHLNVFQIDRLKRMRPGLNKEIALVSFGLGLTVQQFKKLPPCRQKAAQDAHDALYAPAPMISREARQRIRVPRKGEHVSIEQQVDLGRRLLQMKVQLPRGHFIPWIEDKSGISYGQALRWMKAAKDADLDLSRAA